MKLKLWSVQKNGGTDAEGPSPPAAAAAAAQLGVCRLSFVLPQTTQPSKIHTRSARRVQERFSV